MPQIKTDNYSKSKKYNLRRKKEDPPNSSSDSESLSTEIDDDEEDVYSTCSNDSSIPSSNKKSVSDAFSKELIKSIEKSYNKSKNRTVDDVIKYYEDKYSKKREKERKREKEIEKQKQNRKNKKREEFSEEYDSSNYFSSEEDDEPIAESKNKRKYENSTSNRSNINKENKKQKTTKKILDSEIESGEDSSEYEKDSFISDNDDFDDDESYNEEDSKNNLKIMLTIGSNGTGEDNEGTEKEQLNSDEEDIDSDDEKTFMKENYQEFINEFGEDEKNKISNETSKKNKKKNKNKLKTEIQEESATDVENEYLELLDLKKHLFEKLKKKPKNKMLKKALDECKTNMNILIKNARLKNTKLYYNLIKDDKKKTNELEYFKKKLSNKEQLEIVKQLKELNQQMNIDKPYRLSLLQSSIPIKYKSFVFQKLNMLREMSPGDSEYFKVKNWIDTFMKIPFGVYKNFSISINDGIDVCHKFLEDAKNTLDICAYGHEEAKMQIMQMVGQWITNPNALGNAIAIKGAMGTGKTTIIKDGISKILGREFAFIALGGASDGSFLEGHSYTYEGSTWGRIVQILIESKCMNPVIYFDELDKISDTPKGQEIIGILTHLTDTSQNSQFHDKYFSEVDFDLSKCLFIFSYNDESLVNPILRDRMYKIQTKGYEAKDKIIIAKNYLLPKIREQINFREEDIIIPDDTLQYLVNQQKYTKQEEGVRNLKRCLEIIYTKLNLLRLVKPDSNLFSKDLDLNITFPITLTRKHVETLIKIQEDPINKTLLSLYV